MVINGFSELLLGMMSECDPHRRYVEEIRRAGQHAAELTQQLVPRAGPPPPPPPPAKASRASRALRGLAHEHYGHETILLVEDRHYENEFLVATRREHSEANHAALREAYAELQKDKVPQLYYLKADDLLGHDGEGMLMMTVDILPAELPRDASNGFGDVLVNFVKPIADADFEDSFEDLDLPKAIKKGLILHRGELTPDFKYLEEFLEKG